MLKKYAGNKFNILAGSDIFKEYREGEYLYIDKTRFVEHIFQVNDKVILLPRPRRSGKTLNMDMLATFLDITEDNKSLFEDLYISSTQYFKEINQHPILFLSFKNLTYNNIENSIHDYIINIIKAYDIPSSDSIKKYIEAGKHDSNTILLEITRQLQNKYNKQVYLLIDEYDKPITDSTFTDSGSIVRYTLSGILGAVLKGNPYLKKAIITGVTRISHESLLSGLNNLSVYPITEYSLFDTDFMLTEEELSEILDTKHIEYIRPWYNNFRVGDSLLFNMWSTMNYIKEFYLTNKVPRFKNFWTSTGNSTILKKLMDSQKAYQIRKMLVNKTEVEIREEASIEYAYIENKGKCTESQFYTIALQAGYFTHRRIDNTNRLAISIANEELRSEWISILGDSVYEESFSNIKSIFQEINHIDYFSERLESEISHVLSYHDIGRLGLESAYHILFLGLVYDVGNVSSNKESGLGRFDILLKTSQYNAILEFKKSDTEKALKMNAKKAIDQIREQKYYVSLDKDKPIYFIGISCYKNMCMAQTELFNYI